MTKQYKEARARYVAMRNFDAKQERNRGKTAFELVQECAPLDIDRIYKKAELTQEVSE